MTSENYNDWMAIDEHVTVAAKVPEEDFCEAIDSISKTTQAEACEVEDMSVKKFYQ